VLRYRLAPTAFALIVLTAIALPVPESLMAFLPEERNASATNAGNTADVLPRNSDAMLGVFAENPVIGKLRKCGVRLEGGHLTGVRALRGRGLAE